MSLLRALLTGLALAAGPAGAQDTPPRRVVSMNLCTDQLALMLAAPGQLVSVSALSQEPAASPMADAAAGLRANYGLAEDIFLLDPDLVVTGTFSNPATVDMLRRLGIEVALFEPVTDLDDIPERLRRMGTALGRRARAEALATGFSDDLAAIRVVAGARPRAALYQANGYSPGDRTLAGQILAAAGFANVATELGFPGGTFLPLETLVMAAPDLVITSADTGPRARAEEVTDHPVLRSLNRRALTGRDWVCGTPQVLSAIAELIEARP